MTELPDIDVSCRTCIHNNGRTCTAFPKGIPHKYFSGAEAHDSPDSEDNGIQYEPITKEVLEARLGITLQPA